MENTQQYVAKTIHGMEDVLADELKSFGATDVEKGIRVVHFTGDKRTFYTAIYWCRTAQSILKPIDTFTINDQDDYYNAIRRISWYKIFSVDRTFMVKAVISGPIFTNSLYAALRAKDAIVDHFKAAIGDRPNVNKDEPDMVIHVHLRDNELSISLDGAGFPLFKRGYRIAGGSAPINETLAAGILKMSGWDGSTTLVDPMCGSGTFSIEAALMAMGKSPQSVNSYFSIQDWNDFDDPLFDEIRSKPMPHFYFDQKDAIFASDMDAHVIKLAKKNAFRAGIHRRIKFKSIRFEDLEKPDGPCTLFLNPPYGERIDDPDLDGLYMDIGNTLKRKWTGSTAWIISSNMDAIKHIGLKPSVKKTVFNGPLECKLLKFELY